MRYKAKIIFHNTVLTRTFESIGAAESWLDSENNNLENTTIIEELDTNGKTVDWFYYTEKKT